MKIAGEFVNRGGKVVRVEINREGLEPTSTSGTESGTEQSEQPDIEIGGEDGSVYFGAEPVEVKSEMNDTMDVILQHSATIRLQTKTYLAGLFGKTCRDVAVKITRSAGAEAKSGTGELEESEVMFWGWVEPMAYSQGWNEVWDELEVSCVDWLGALQYSNYNKAGQSGVSYDELVEQAQSRTIGEILKECLMDASGGGMGKIWYDGSKRLSAEGTAVEIWEGVKVSDLLFLDDDEESVWTEEEVVEAVLRYLGLHIEQRGEDFYVFDWESVSKGEDIEWTDITGGETKTSLRVGAEAKSGTGESGTEGEGSDTGAIEISIDNVADDGTQISVGEAYNQIGVKCDVVKQDTAVENPLDDDGLIKMFTGQQKYLTEYGSDGDGARAQNAMAAMITGGSTDYGSAYETDWYVQVYRHIRWKFPLEGNESKNLLTELFGASSTSEKRVHQERLANYLSEHVAAGIMSIGKVDKKADNTDNSPVSKIDTTKYMIIGVNGNGEDDASTYQPNNAALRAAIPVAVYTGAKAGGSFTPTDSGVTNYFVISGTLRLNQLSVMSELVVDHNDYGSVDGEQVKRYKGYNAIKEHIDERRYGHLTAVGSNTNRKGRIYLREYWTAEDCKDVPEVDGSRVDGLIVPTEKKDAEYEYKYSAIGERQDTVSKVGVLQCMLIVGDKCVVERQTGVSYSGTAEDGTPTGSATIAQVGRGKYAPEYVWQTYKTLEECGGDIDEYLQQSFTIGFDPKVGDKLVGTDFEIANNIDYTMGLDGEEGTAIPIKTGDKVSGRVIFKILGPVNLTWDVITRRHPTCFRHTQWSSSSVPLMAHVSNIMIKDFEIKIVSDNGGLDTAEEEKDLVYLSDTDETYVNKKDDIEMKIQSGLTAEEAAKIGVTTTVKLSNAMDKDGGVLMEIYNANTGETGKAEQMYVDGVWREWHEPRVEMEQRLRADVNRWGIYKSVAMSKEFWVEGMGWDGAADEWTLKMKEK